jgi:hypothetical protein
VVGDHVAERAGAVVELAATVSAAVIWTCAMQSEFQTRSIIMFANRAVMMFWTVSLPRKWSIR